MRRYTVEVTHNNNRQTASFVSDDANSIIDIVMALIGCSPMWSAFSVSITPQGSKKVSFLHPGKKNMTYDTNPDRLGLRDRLTDFFPSTEETAKAA